MQKAGGLHYSGNTVSLLLQTTFICWLITKKIGWKLWVSERLFPVVPPFDFLYMPAAVHWFLLITVAALLIILIFNPGNKYLQIGLLTAELVSCLLDQNRWQPWEYQYLFIVVISIINHHQKQKIITCIAFIMAATYLYSGLGKLNPGFLILFWDKMVLAQYFKIGNALINHPYIYYCGYIIGVIEILAAAGLFFLKTQKISAAALIMMHLVILILLGPFGLHYNKIIWPWNMLMMVQLWLIFLNKETVPININALWKGWNKIIIICWGVLPALNYAGLWDSYLSSRLYSGSLPQMVFCIKDSAEIKMLKPYLNKSDLYNVCKADALVNIQTWAMKEMNTAPCPQLRVYKKIKEQWLKKYPGSSTKFVFYFPVGYKEIKIIE